MGKGKRLRENRKGKNNKWEHIPNGMMMVVPPLSTVAQQGTMPFVIPSPYNKKRRKKELNEELKGIS